MAPMDSQLCKKRNLEDEGHKQNAVPRESVQMGSVRVQTRWKKAGKNEGREEGKVGMPVKKGS